MDRESLKVLNENLCKYFRSKGMFVFGTPNPDPTPDETGDDDDIAGDGYCWCLKSGQVLGPDKESVSRRLCQPGRSCYQSPDE